MRGTTLALVLALGGTLGLLGCDNLAVVNGETACDLAAQHIAACSGQSAPGTATCDAQAEAEANTILGLDCATLAALGKTDEGRSITSTQCDADQKEQCHDMCVKLFEQNGLRLKRSSCEILEPGDELADGQTATENTVHCKCKGYWLPW
jgi:hypothetical protein